MEGNSVGIFVSKVSPGIFVIGKKVKGKINTYYFRRNKTAVLGAKKAQLPFSEGKYQLLNSWDKIPSPTIFYQLNFQLPHLNRWNDVSLHKDPFKKP